MSTERLRGTTKKGFAWWADVRTEWPYGADAKVAGALLFTEDPESFENGQRVLLQQSVTDAHVPDLAGNPLPFGPDVWEECDGQVGRRILTACRRNWGQWQKDADPNDTSESSDASPSPAPAS